MEPAQGKFEVEKFDGQGDFGLWKFKMLMQLELQGLEFVLEEEESSTISVKGKEKEGEILEAKSSPVDPLKKEKDKRAKNLICSCLSNMILRKVMKETTALGVWKALERDYQTKSLPNRIYLKQRFASFKMEEHKSIEENLDVFLKLVDDLASLNINVNDEDQAIQVLSSLPKQYDSLVHTLKYGNGKETLTLNEVTSSAYAKEVELREKGLIGKGKSIAEGLVVQRGRPEKKNSGQGKGRSKSKDGRSKSRPRSQPKPRECWICGKEGHFKKECPERKQLKSTDSANVAQEKELPMVLTASTQDTMKEWVMDSGCTFHITPDRDVLFDFKEFDGGKVLMGNNTFNEVKGMGKLKIINSEGATVILTDVRYVPSMSKNLISYGQLEKHGCKYEGEDFMVTFYRKGQMVISGKYQNGLYYLQGTVVKGEASVVRAEVNLTNRWHSRLGHMSLKNMNLLVKGGYLDSKEVHTLDFCEECVLGKSHKQSFPEGKHTSKGILEYIHSDLWGSVSNEPSLSGCRYFLTFIDDYSRKVWIRFLKSKDEVFENFSEWKTLVENQTGKKIKCLRTDNGLEFCNNQMDQLCQVSGIKRHRTCVYTPQQNGVSERMNRTIADKIRCMLAETGMEKKFWAEAAATAVYLINRSPNASLKFQIPEEVWSGSKVDYSHLRRFGCLAYVHMTQDKIGPRAVKGIFMGYPQGTKGYRVWLPEEGKCTISRNVVFDEEKLYKDQDQREVAKSKKKKKVTFSTELIQGPTPNGSVQESIGQGGEASGSRDSTGQGGDTSESSESETESEEEKESEEEVENQNDHESFDDYLLARDRERRVIRPPSRFEGSDFVAYALSTAESLEMDEPKTVAEARRSRDWEKWNQAMVEEKKSLDKNKTMEIVPKPRKQRIIGCKWIFKLKEGIPGVEEARYKARLVAKGFTQVEGVDYNEIFAPVVKHVSIRIMLSVVVNFDLELEQLDVKTAFLHGTLDEVIYMSQPEGFIEKGNEDKVCLLKKSLYGLKQSPRQWNQKFDDFMKSQEFQRSMKDPCVYTKGSCIDDMVYLLLYVDDMLVAAKDMEKIKVLKASLKEKFEMKDLGPATRILGMDIIRDRKKGILKLSQEKYIKRVLRTFSMEDCRAVVTPANSQFKLKSLTQEELITETRLMSSVPYASAVGSLMYAMIGTRPDLAYAVGLVSRFMANPGRSHWSAVKWILRYLKGASDVCLTFTKAEKFEIEGFCDSDYASDLDRRRSISGYVFKVGGNTVSWRSTLQHVVALSTTEAEYMALTEAAKEGIWLKIFCSELGFDSESFKLNCDSQSAICLAKNPIHHDRTKHFENKVHFIRDKVEDGSVKVQKIHTSLNPADMLTKCLPGNSFERCLVTLNVTT